MMSPPSFKRETSEEERKCLLGAASDFVFYSLTREIQVFLLKIDRLLLFFDFSKIQNKNKSITSENFFGSIETFVAAVLFFPLSLSLSLSLFSIHKIGRVPKHECWTSLRASSQRNRWFEQNLLFLFLFFILCFKMNKFFFLFPRFVLEIKHFL